MGVRLPVYLMAAVSAAGIAAGGPRQLPAGLTIVTAADPAPDAPTDRLEAWRFVEGGGTYERIWQARPRFVAPPDGDALPYLSGAPVIADLDGDGQAELAVADRFGIAIYGRTPAYRPFASVVDGPTAASAGDIDADGKLELLTLRAFPREGVQGIEAWSLSGGALARLGSVTVPAAPADSAFVLENVDDDGGLELVVAGDGIHVLRHEAGLSFAREGTVPIPAAPGATGATAQATHAIRVADVTGDGARELVLSAGGRVLVFRRAREAAGVSAYQLLWASESIGALGLGVGDATGDGRPEIVVATREAGVQVLAHVEAGAFDLVWQAERGPGSTAPAIGDVDGDGANELVIDGRSVYGFDPAAGAFRVEGRVASADAPGQRGQAAIGPLGVLAEPVTALRIVPTGWAGPAPAIAPGGRARIALVLHNAWAAARDVVVDVEALTTGLTVERGTLRVGEIAAGETVATPAFEAIAAPGMRGPAYLRVTIRAAGGYRQSGIEIALRR